MNSLTSESMSPSLLVTSLTRYPIKKTSRLVASEVFFGYPRTEIASMPA